MIAAARALIAVRVPRSMARCALSLALASPIASLALPIACGGGAASLKPTTTDRMNGEGIRRLERGDALGAEEAFREALKEAAPSQEQIAFAALMRGVHW